ncbi:Peptidyl-trna hydrolase 2, partial [Globisporangium splendens]
MADFRPVLKEGYLKKRSRDNALIKNWRRRYFKLLHSEEMPALLHAVEQVCVVPQGLNARHMEACHVVTSHWVPHRERLNELVKTHKEGTFSIHRTPELLNAMEVHTEGIGGARELDEESIYASVSASGETLDSQQEMIEKKIDEIRRGQREAPSSLHLDLEDPNSVPDILVASAETMERESGEWKSLSPSKRVIQALSPHEKQTSWKIVTSESTSPTKLRQQAVVFEAKMASTGSTSPRRKSSLGDEIKELLKSPSKWLLSNSEPVVERIRPEEFFPQAESICGESMADSDSDDELMSRLTSAMTARAAVIHEDCVHCGAPNAAVVCSICHSAHYCSEKEQSEEEEDSSEEEESDSESEDVAHASISRSGSVSSRRSSGPGSGGLQVPGLTENQIKKLLELSSKAESITNNKIIDQLQTQIAQLMESQSKATSQPSSVRDRTTSSSAPVKLKDIKELQKKLQELEKKTQNMPVGAVGGVRSIYRPLLVKDDPEFRKYFKLKDMAMPTEQIKAKMEGDGVNPSLLDTPDEVSPNDPGPAPGAYIPLTVGNDPVFKKYFKLKSMNMPIEQIKLKMEADGVDPDLLDHPTQVSPNDPGPPLPVDKSPYLDPNAMRMSMPSFPAGMLPPATAPSPPYVPLLIKDDPAFKKYFKLLQMGMPLEQAQLKMSAEQMDATVLNRPDDVSPNDPGPPPATVGAVNGTSGPVSMEQLFSILMQHQQIIQNVSSGGGMHLSGRSPSGSGEGFAVPHRSVEDQMARELADAESAIDDIFGDEQQTTKGLGGMSMIEQLEKKARKESNKKLVDNRDKVNRMIAELLAKKLASDEEAIKFYSEMCPKLEALGLSLGVDAVQTWSARLLIKNKDTRDWYFSEQERLDAGKAYNRLWSLSFLDRDAGQLIAKRAQIINAPATLRAGMKNKPELIDKFTQLLKDTVKLKHKIFKNTLYGAELRRLRENGIPERFDERGTELIDSSTVLADAAMELAEEEFRLLETATRAKKFRAHTTIHVAEKAIQLVGIVKKLGAHGVNNDRLSAVETKVNELKEIYVTGQQEEEEEDDVL